MSEPKSWLSWVEEDKAAIRVVPLSAYEALRAEVERLKELLKTQNIALKEAHEIASRHYNNYNELVHETVSLSKTTESYRAILARIQPHMREVEYDELVFEARAALSEEKHE